MSILYLEGSHEMATTQSNIGTLAGKLIDKRSSLPLVGARLSIVGHDGRATFAATNGAGEFKIALPEGTYDLAISARGYLSMLVRGIGVLGEHRSEMVRGLVPGEGADAHSEPTTSIGGYARDRLGDPIANLIVELRSGAHKQTTRTERNGAYIFHGVPLGEFDMYFRSGEQALAKTPVAIPSARAFVRIDQRIEML